MTLILRTFNAIGIAIWLSSCQQYPIREYIVVEKTIHDNKIMKLNPRPKLLKIKSDELQCLSDETYQKLKTRFELIKAYAISLESKIIEHNAGQIK
jgi:hypothetical protein